MAGPSNPFSGPTQVDGAAGSTGRGRGFHGRSVSHLSKAPNARGTNTRGRGRGAPPATRSGRGRGVASNTWRRKPESNISNESSNSPSAQLKQNSPSSFPNGQPPSQNPFSRAAASSGMRRTSPGQDKAMVDSSRDPRRQASAKPINGTAGVPVEDASILTWYNDRFEQLKIDRTKERERAIREGQMADPNQPTYLNQAITPVGTCTSMCPEFERVERIVQKMVDKSEKFLHPSTNSLQYMETKMLKRFRRSAAGYDEQLPSDIRTPNALLQTTNYLVRHVIGGPEPLGVIHKFVWDRTRSIRNDFSVQQVTQEDHVKIAVTCLERIARFHIVSLHLLSNPANSEQFDRHQEREQLNNTMLSLMYYYDDNRGRVSFANEDEFRAYYIIFSIHDQRPDLEARAQKWPPELRNSPRVQAALELYAAASNTWEYQGALDARRPNPIAQGFYTRFFSLVDSRSVSYLMACVAEIYFNHVRQTAIRSIWKAYCRIPASQQHKNEEWTIDELTTVLAFDDNGQTIRFCEEQDLELAENSDGELHLNWGSRPVDSVAFQPSSDHGYSEKTVESKRGGRTLIAVILGLSIKEATSLGMIDTSLLTKRELALPAAKSEASGDDESLFVSEDDNDVQPSSNLTNGSVAEISGFGGTADSASSLRDEVEESSQSPSSGPAVFQPDNSTTPFQKSPPSQPSEPPKTFSSLFAAGTTNSASPFTQFTTPGPNPFGGSSSPFTPKKPEEAHIDTSVSSSATPHQSAPAFQSPFSLFQSADKQDDVVAPAPTSTTPQFIPPSFSQPTVAPTTAAPTAASTTTQFKLPNFSSAPSPPPVSTTPQFEFPGLPQATSSPPALSPPTTADANKNAGLTAGQPRASVFDSVKPSPFSTNDASAFNFPSQDTAPENVAAEPSSAEPTTAFKFPTHTTPSQIGAEEHPAEAENSVQENPSPFLPPSGLFWPKQKELSSGVSSTTPETASSSIFSDAKAATALAPGPNKVEKQEAPVSAAAENQVEDVPLVVEEQVSSNPNPIDQPEPLYAQLANAPALSAPPGPEPKVPAIITETIPAAPRTEEATADGEPSTAVDSEEYPQSWIDFLRGAALKRRQEPPTSRKRVRDEQQEKEPEESIPKTPKMPKPDGAQHKTSLALSSIKPLPKLPILERIESMTTRKPVVEKKPEPPKPSQVDEDELLLSAARIAAESLRSGPRLFDDMAINHEPRRTSFSPPRSFSSSLPLSRSMSPQSPAGGHGVAYAPDTNLGLGRTMSRTEQRIRMTGGKGLAYKPLDFTPPKKRKDKGKEKERK